MKYPLIIKLVHLATLYIPLGIYLIVKEIRLVRFQRKLQILSVVKIRLYKRNHKDPDYSEYFNAMVTVIKTRYVTVHYEVMKPGFVQPEQVLKSELRPLTRKDREYLSRQWKDQDHLLRVFTKLYMNDKVN